MEGEHRDIATGEGERRLKTRCFSIIDSAGSVPERLQGTSCVANKSHKIAPERSWRMRQAGGSMSISEET
jgi:hypothetical protein